MPALTHLSPAFFARVEIGAILSAMVRWLSLVLALLLSACSEEGPNPPIDRGPRPDLGPLPDLGPPPDRGPPPDLGPDVGPPDFGPDFGPFDAGPDLGPVDGGVNGGVDGGPTDIGPNSISIDGLVTDAEWSGTDVIVFENGTDAAVPFVDNALTRVRAVRRGGYFLLAIEGERTDGNGYVVYVDVAYDSGDGVALFLELADRSDDLPQLITKEDINVQDGLYRLDFAWAAFRESRTEGESGWFDVESNTAAYAQVDPMVEDVPSVCVDDVCETRIPESVLGTEPGSDIAFFVRLGNRSLAGLSNQTLPEDDPTDPALVSELGIAFVPEP